MKCRDWLVILAGLVLASSAGCNAIAPNASQELALFQATVKVLQDSVGKPLDVLAQPFPDDGIRAILRPSNARLHAIATERAGWLIQMGMNPRAPPYEPCDGFLRPARDRRTAGCPKEHHVIAEVSLSRGNSHNRTVTLRIRNMQPFGSNETLNDYNFALRAGRWVLISTKQQAIME